MTDPRPDLVDVRRQIKRLVTVIVVVVASVLTLTFYLYERFTAGVTIAK
jgi:hypothetical protein